MAVATPTAHDFGGDDTDNSTTTTNSKTFTANRLYCLWIGSRTGITANPNIPTCTGGNVTWGSIANGTKVIDDTSSSRRRMTLLYGICSSTTTGTLGIDFGGQTQTSDIWILEEIASGFDATTPIVQAANAYSMSAVTSITATLAAFGSANNATYGCFGVSNGTRDPSPGSGFATITPFVTSAEAGVGLETEFRVDNDTTVDFTFGSDSELGCIGVEIKAAAAAVTARELAILGVGN